MLTGGKAITEDLGITLENVKMKDLGQAKKVTIDKERFYFFEFRAKEFFNRPPVLNNPLVYGVCAASVLV